MKKYTFVISAIILALGGFFAKAIGALYKIPLTNILGSSGMGLYYLIFPIYSLIITLCSSGLSVALSTEVAKCRKIRHKYNEQKLLRVALIFSFIISSVFAIIILIVSKPLAELQGNINAYRGYVAISPAIIISCIIATLRGYFQGIENMIPTTISLIIEQIIKLSVGLILAHKLCKYGIQYAVLGAVIGVTISEVIALIIIVINFISYKGQLHYNYRNLNYKSKRCYRLNKILKLAKYYKKTSKNIKQIYYKVSSKTVRYTTKQAFGLLLKTIIPSTFSSIVIPIATMLDSFMIINILISSGLSSHVSTSLYGLSSGVVQSLISLPTIIIMAISTAVVPSLSGVVVRNDTNELKYRTAFFIKITWLLSIIIFVLMYLFSSDIIKFLYGDGLTSNVIDEFYYATKLLQISSVSIIYYAFLQSFTTIMQTIGKSHIPFWSLFLSLIIRTILIYLLVKITSINIFGSVIANIIFLIISTIILAIYLKRYIELEYLFYRNLLKPMIIGMVVMIIGVIVKYLLNSVLNYFVAMIISGLLCIIIFVVAVFFGKIFTVREQKTFSSKKIFKRKNANK